MELDTQLAHLAIQVRQSATYGTPVDPAACEEIYIIARNQWIDSPHDPTQEARGRYAGLIYGGALGLQRDWSFAAAMYREPFEQTPVGEGCEMFAGLMAVGRAVTSWHLADKDGAGWESTTALKLLGRASSKRFDRWRDIAILIRDITIPHDSSGAISPPRSLLDGTKQPQARRLATYVQDAPGCYRTMFELMELGYDIPATEGLYLFNEGV